MMLIPRKKPTFLFPLLIATLAVLTGCAATMKEAQFQNSNQIFLERTVSNLDVAPMISEFIPEGSTISLVSLERDETGDSPLVATIEDELISSLVSYGYNVLERDEDMLKRLVSEDPQGRLRFVYLPSDDIRVSSAAARAGVTRGSMSSSGYLSGALGVTEITGVGRDTVIVFDTQLDPASYLVSYRVRECGIVYHKGSSVDMKKREGMVRLHLRIQDAQSGRVLLAENLVSSLEDEVDKDLVDDLENYRYSFFSSDLPMVRGSRSTPREMDRQEEREQVKILGGLLGLVAVAAVIALAL
jgi:hypothetical protein